MNQPEQVGKLTSLAGKFFRKGTTATANSSAETVPSLNVTSIKTVEAQQISAIAGPVSTYPLSAAYFRKSTKCPTLELIKVRESRKPTIVRPHAPSSKAE